MTNKAIKMRDLRRQQVNDMYKLFRYSRAFAEPIGYIKFKNHKVMRQVRERENAVNATMARIHRSANSL